MTFFAQFSSLNNNSYVTKALSAESQYTFEFETYMPLLTMQQNGDADLIEILGQSNGVYAESSTNNWWTDAGGGPAGTVVDLADTWFPIKMVATNTGGSNWSCDTYVNGVLLFSGETFTSSTYDIQVGALFAGVKPGRFYYIRNVSVKNAAMSVIFSDDFSSGDFSAWDSVTNPVGAQVVSGFPVLPTVSQPFYAKFDGSAFASKTVAASSKHTIAWTCLTPQTTLTGLGLVAGHQTASFLVATDATDADDIFSVYNTGHIIDGAEVDQWEWWSSAGTLNPGGELLPDTWMTVSVEATYVSGTNWDLLWSVSGQPMFYNTALDLGVTDTDPFTFDAGGVFVTGIYYGASVEVRDASDSVVFADDFASGDFSEWTSTSGDTSIVTSIIPPIPPAGIPYRSPAWRFVVLDRATFEVLSILDPIATNRTVTLTLDAPAQAVLNVPSDNPEVNIPWPTIDDDPFVTEGTRTLLGLRRDGTYPDVWTPRFHGVIEQLEDTAEQDNAFTQLTAWDPWQNLMARPVQNLDGSLPGVNGLSFGMTRVDVIVATLLRNTILNNDFPLSTPEQIIGIDAGDGSTGSPPAYQDWGGTSFYTGTLDASDMIDINFQQGTSVGEAWQQLTNLYECDIWIEPIYDPINRPGYLGQLNVVSQMGAERDDSIFAWDLPSKSLVQISRLYDGTLRANNVKFFSGQGGSASGGQDIAVQTDWASVMKYGEYWRQQFFPGQNVARVVELLAQAELAFSKNGRQTVTISPAPERSPHPFDEYFLGDRVPVYASGTKFRAPLSGYQRIYGIPLTIGDDGTEMVQQLLTTEPTS
jgi:hypothetical protein